jgi:hypothetical protein
MSDVVGEAVASLHSGVELRRVERAGEVPNTPYGFAQAASSTEMVSLFECARLNGGDDSLRSDG